MPFLAAIPALLGAAGVAVPTALTVGLGAATGALGIAQGIAQHDPLMALGGALSAIPGLPGGAGLGLNAAKSAVSTAQGIKNKDLLGTLASAGMGIGAGLNAAKDLTPNATKAFLGESYTAPTGQSPWNSLANAGNKTGNLSGTTAGLLEAKNIPPMTTAVVPSVYHSPNTIPESIPSSPQNNTVASSAPTQADLLKMLDSIGNAPKKMSKFEQAATALGGVGAAAQGVMSLINSFKNHDATTKWNLANMGAPNLSAAGGVQAGALPNVPQLSQQSPGQVPQYKIPEISTDPLLLKLLGAYQT